MSNKKETINFIIPDFLNVDICNYIITMLKDYKKTFKDGVNILGVTGMFPGCVWNIRDKSFDVYRTIYTEDFVIQISKKYLSLNTSLIINFDQNTITEDDLYDEYANMIMRVFDDEHNYVICKSRKLLDYIKKNYRKIKTIEYYNGEDSGSDYLILDPSYNTNKSIFELSYKNKFILQPDCGFIQNRKWMFNHSKKDFILNPLNPKKDEYYIKNNSVTFYEIKNSNHYIDYKKLISFSEKGVNISILSGNGFYNVAMFDNIIQYLIKAEYQADFRLRYMDSLLKLIEEMEKAVYEGKF